jgi:hypothetical protein
MREKKNKWRKKKREEESSLKINWRQIKGGERAHRENVPRAATRYGLSRFTTWSPLSPPWHPLWALGHHRIRRHLGLCSSYIRHKHQELLGPCYGEQRRRQP